MSIFIKIVRICLFITAVSCAGTFAHDRPRASSLAIGADGSDAAFNQANFEDRWDHGGLPLLASLMQSVPNHDQEPTLETPASIWQQKLAAKLNETSAKWTELQSRILADKETLAACRSGNRPCPAAARRFLSIVELARHRHGRARFGEINRAINLSIRPMSDLAQYGVDDYWASPLTALGNGAGDCEDYAIAKYVALEESGIAPEDLQLEIVRDVQHQKTHAVIAVHYENEWLILDNRTLFMVSADESPYQYLFALDHRGARTFATEVARRRAAQSGVPVSYLQSGQATRISSNPTMTNRLQKVD